MGGKPQTLSKLSSSLLTTVDILFSNNITRWHISYGTLLGIVRDGNPIDGDDDVDINIPTQDTELVAKALQDAGVKVSKCEGMLRLNLGKNTAPVDIYQCDLSDKGDYTLRRINDTWTECYENLENETFETIEWNGRNLNVPKNYKQKLQNIYGKDWTKRIKNKKGPSSYGNNRKKNIRF